MEIPMASGNGLGIQPLSPIGEYLSPEILGRLEEKYAEATATVSEIIIKYREHLEENGKRS
jgi:hypothetical protein